MRLAYSNIILTAALGIAILVSSQSLRAEPSPDPSATPAPTATPDATATPVPSATPTATPTPTPPPPACSNDFVSRFAVADDQLSKASAFVNANETPPN